MVGMCRDVAFTSGRQQLLEIARSYTCYSMCMSVLERRVQILIQREAYERLERVASKQSRSVASVIREAIGQYLDDGRDARERALATLLAEPLTEGPGENWDVSKHHLDSATPSYS